MDWLLALLLDMLIGGVETKLFGDLVTLGTVWLTI
jgi:hypothetical protein